LPLLSEPEEEEELDGQFPLESGVDPSGHVDWLLEEEEDPDEELGQFPLESG
jgi:hypothetical protein